MEIETFTSTAPSSAASLTDNSSVYETSFVDEPTNTFASDLRLLVNDYPAIPCTAITRILKLMREHKTTLQSEVIPADYRSLMSTPRGEHALVKEIAPKTTFYYFGIETTLKKYSIFVTQKTVKLGVYIDGVDGDKSTGLVHWPILGKIYDIETNIIFTIALHTGYSKPLCVETYLRQFVNEINHLTLNGILIDGREREFRLIRILGDAPARCFFLNTVGHNGFDHCLYCDIHGDRLYNRNFFYEISPCLERNSADFNALKYVHSLQKDRTPLMDLINFDVMKMCPYDPMHMVMRIIKTMLGFLVENEKHKIRKILSEMYRMTDAVINVISCRLLKVRKPVEFQQRGRSIFRKFRKWKATECRFFLLYVGPLLLRKQVSTEVYKNFLLLHFSFRILSAEKSTREEIHRVREYLHKFVHTFVNIYGAETIGHYLHATLHLVDQVLEHGSLDAYAAYLYESHIGLYKHYKHGPRAPGQQVVNRLIERQIASRDLYLQNKRSCIFPDNVEYPDGSFPSHFQRHDFMTYSQINLHSCTINVKKNSDNLIFLKNGQIFRVQNILRNRHDGAIYFFGYPLRQRKNFYNYPEVSSKVGYFIATDDDAATYFQEVVSVLEFSCKSVCVPFTRNHQVVAIRMLH